MSQRPTNTTQFTSPTVLRRVSRQSQGDETRSQVSAEKMSSRRRLSQNTVSVFYRTFDSQNPIPRFSSETKSAQKRKEVRRMAPVAPFLTPNLKKTTHEVIGKLYGGHTRVRASQRSEGSPEPDPLAAYLSPTKSELQKSVIETNPESSIFKSLEKKKVTKVKPKKLKKGSVKAMKVLKVSLKQEPKPVQVNIKHLNIRVSPKQKPVKSHLSKYFGLYKVRNSKPYTSMRKTSREYSSSSDSRSTLHHLNSHTISRDSSLEDRSHHFHSTVSHYQRLPTTAKEVEKVVKQQRKEMGVQSQEINRLKQKVNRLQRTLKQERQQWATVFKEKKMLVSRVEEMTR